MFPILREEGRKFKVAWRAANARTAVPYFKITKKAAKQTIPLRHRHSRSRTIPTLPPYRPLGPERKDKESVRGSKERFNLSEHEEQTRLKVPVLFNSHRRRIYRNELILPEDDVASNIVRAYENEISIHRAFSRRV